MSESNYWLRINGAIDGSDDELNYLTKESEELKKILGSISSKISSKYFLIFNFTFLIVPCIKNPTYAQ